MPDWYSLSKDVAEKTETWEAYAAFHKKVDACWENYVSKLKGLTLNQLNEQSAEIAATMLCYGQLRELSWQKTWIAYLNQVEDPLAAVRDAMLTILGSEVQEKFDTAMWGLMDKADLEGGQGKEAGQELG